MDTPWLKHAGNRLALGQVYSLRRMDKPGLWATISRIEDGEWINGNSEPLWEQHTTGLSRVEENMVENFNALKFGGPTIRRLSDGTIFIAFWGLENGVTLIRWFKLREEDL